MNHKREENQAAYGITKQELSNQFSLGHYVAFDDGRIVADASSFDELTAALVRVGKDEPDVFVVQVGVDYPDEVFILL